MARGGRDGRRRRRGRRGGGSAQGDGSEPSFVARPVPAHDELTPYLRTGLTPPLFKRAVVASLQEQEVLDAEADEVIAEGVEVLSAIERGVTTRKMWMYYGISVWCGCTTVLG